MSANDAESDTALAPVATKGARHWILIALKLGVTLGVLGILAAKADWSTIGARLAAAKPGWIIAALAVNATGVALATERWYRALAAASLHYRRIVLLRIVIVAIFIGQVLPGGVGADAVRGWLTYRAGEKKPQAVISAVLLDRVLALAAAVVLLTAALPRLIPLAPPAFAWTAGLAALALASGLVVLAELDRIPLPRVLKRPPIPLLLDQARLLRRVLWTGPAIAGGLCAILVHLGTVVSVACLARAVGVSLPLADALTIVPVAIIAAALPVSLNGWGIREGAMAAGMALFGIGTGEALVISMLQGFALMVLSLPGAPLWLTLRRANS